MQHFFDQAKLDEHLETCRSRESVKTEMLEKGKFEQFKNPQQAAEVPFVVYAYFECVLETQVEAPSAASGPK